MITYIDYKKAKLNLKKHKGFPLKLAKAQKTIASYEKQENKKLNSLKRGYGLDILVGDSVRTLKGSKKSKGFKATVLGYLIYRDFDAVKVLKKNKKVVVCLAHNLVKC